MLRKLLTGYVLLLTALCARSQCPTVSITSEKTAYCISDFVELKASNVPLSATVEWDLGLGWDTTEAHHWGSAATPGMLTANLRLTLATGESCVYSEADVAQIHDLPVADFTTSEQLFCTLREEVILVDQTPTSVRRNWVINQETLENTPKITSQPIAKAGSYDITLVAEDQNGCRGSKTVKNAIRAYPGIPLDFVKSNNSNCYPITTDYTSIINPGIQTVTDYEWNLPGSNSTIVNTEHVTRVQYNSVGVYDTRLKVSTREGCVYTYEKRSYITLGDTATLGVTTNKSGACLSEKIYLTQTTAGLPGTFTWGIAAATFDHPTKNQATITFKDTGTYTLNLTYDHNNCISSLVKSDLIKIQGLKSDFISDNAWHCDTPHTVELINISDTSSGKISGFQWRVINALDNTIVATSTSKDFDITIKESPAIYDVELITTAASGCSDTTVKSEFIQVESYQFDFFAKPNIGCVGQDFTFINQTPSGSYYGLDLFSWDFYNKDKSSVLGSSGSTSPKFVYSDTGYYHVQLTAANPLGCQEKYMLDSAVQVVSPSIDYNWEDSITCSNEFFDLIGRSTPVNPQFINAYTFRHKLTGQTTSFSGDTVPGILSDIGEYEVVYHYTISGGCDDSLVNSFWVNGLKGRIALDTQTGCSPLQVRPRFVVDYNVHKGFSDTSLNYYWTVLPRTGVTIKGGTTATPIITLNEDLEYRIALYVNNSSGCVNYLVSDTIATGVKAQLMVSQLEACVGDTIHLTNTSTNTPSSVIWNIQSTSSYTIDRIDSNRRDLVLQDSGSYNVSLIATKNGLCSDTVSYDISTTELSAKFTVSDSILSCAPADVWFINQSRNADVLEWFFGDDQTTRVGGQDSTHHQYLVNSDSSGFDIMLIAKSNFGCADTFIRNDLVKLKGPIAAFDVQNTKGCEPLEVSITNQSKHYDTSYFSYGIGLEIDTNTVSDYTYSNTASSSVVYYQPSMTVIDKGGCSATYTLEDSIAVFKLPEIKLHILPDTIVCHRENLVVTDTGEFGYRWNWFLNNQMVSTSLLDTITATIEGENILRLVVTNPHCSDTAEQSIWASESAKINFKLPDFLCEKVPFTVGLSLDNKTAPSAYRWDFGEPGNPNNIQITADSSASISYLSPGPKTIKVTAELPNGCAIPDTIRIEVFDSKNVPVIEPDYAGYDSNNRVIIQYPDFDFDYFDFFNIQRDGSLLKKASQTPNSQLTDSSLTTRTRACYSLSVSDKCGVEGPKSRVHCPVLLDVNSPQAEQVELNWTYYVGWDRVEHYEIYRREKDSAFKKIGQVFNTQRTYIDSAGLCNREYAYKIAAVKEGDTLVSYSNTELIEPEYILNFTEPNIDNVSVLLNQDIEVRWSGSPVLQSPHYLLTKYESTMDNVLGEIEVKDTHYVDNDVQSDLYSYMYTVKEIDRCLNIGTAGQYGKTILLKARFDEQNPVLNWSAYEQWRSPVISHNIEFVRPGGSIQVDQVSPATYSYTDASFYEDVDGFYPYRVYAVNEQGDTSYSNISRVSGKPVFLAPNSFSPNNDGINDVLNFYTLFVVNDFNKPVSDFDIMVYNRWGNRVFLGHDLKQGWDGKQDGKLLPKGVYLFRIGYTDGDGRRYWITGTVHLMR